MRLPAERSFSTCLAEMLLEGAQDAERRGQVDVEDGVPLLVAHLLDDRVPGVAGVVHHDMAVAEGVDRGLDDAVAEVGLGDVAVAGHRLAAQLGDLGDGLLGRRLVDVVDHHLGAVAHQAQRDLLADAASRAGDDRHLAVHLTHVFLLSLGARHSSGASSVSAAHDAPSEWRVPASRRHGGVALQRVLAVLVGALDLEVDQLLAVLLALAGDLAAEA